MRDLLTCIPLKLFAQGKFWLTSNNLQFWGVFPQKQRKEGVLIHISTVSACIIKDNTLPFKGSFVWVTVFIIKKKHELEIIASNFIPHSEASWMLAKHLFQMWKQVLGIWQSYWLCTKRVVLVSLIQGTWEMFWYPVQISGGKKNTVHLSFPLYIAY